MVHKKWKNTEKSPSSSVHMVHGNYTKNGKIIVMWGKKGSKWKHDQDFPSVKTAKTFAKKKAKSMDLGSVSYYNSQGNPTGFDVDYSKPKKKVSKATNYNKRKTKSKPRKRSKPRKPKTIFDVLGDLI